MKIYIAIIKANIRIDALREAGRDTVSKIIFASYLFVTFAVEERSVLREIPLSTLSGPADSFSIPVTTRTPSPLISESDPREGKRRERTPL